MMHELIEMAILENIHGDHAHSWEGMRVKLTCGCWSEWAHRASPIWTIPGEPHRCPHHGWRQIHLVVQVMLMEGAA